MKKTILLLLLTCITGFTINAQNSALLWAKAMGSSAGTDIGLSVAVDASGNVYTTGYFSGTVDFDPGAGSFPLTAGGTVDMYVLKLDASGNFVWAVAMGSTGYDQGNDIALDASGNVYVSGYFQATVDFDPGVGSFPLTSAGGTDIMVVKLDAAGSFAWAKAMGGTGDDYGQAIALDASANVYSTGYFAATADFDPGAGVANLTSAGAKDIFVSKLDVNGNLVWARRNGSTGDDQALAIAVDASANVYMGGSFSGTVDFDPGAGTVNLTAVGLSLFVYKLNAAGTFVWARNTGSGGSGETQGLALDASGNVYTTGYFTGTVDFDPGAANFNLTAPGYGDIFLSKLDAAGTFVWAKNMGGANYYPSFDVAVDITGNAYITGYFTGTVDFDPGAGTSNLTAAGNNDIFIVSFTGAGTFVWAKQQGSTSSEYGYGITTDASQNVYVTGAFNGTVDFDDGPGVTNLTSLGGAGDMFIQKIGYPVGAALNFDGADDKVTVPANAAFNFTTGTVECWFNSAGSSDNEVVACMRTATSNTRWSIHVNESANEVGIYNGVTYQSSPAGTINPNTWYHLACVMTPTNTTFYLNGILAGSVNAGIVTSFTGIPVCIGSVNDASYPNENFTGSIDEVRIWNTVRTACEINTYKNCEIATTATGLLANYHFNQGAATTSNPTITILSDVSGNSNPGTLTGFALTGLASNWVVPGAIVSGYNTPDVVSGTTLITNASCFGGSNGAINLTPSGGKTPYTFNWGVGITTEDRTGITAGTYTVIITDANGCTGTVTATVNQPTAPASGTTVVTNIACFGGSTGAVNLTPSGGTTPYTFNWGGGITTEDRTGLTAGIYTVIITDGNSCTGTVTATVTEPAAAVSGTTVVTNACFGVSNGAINLTATGGTPGYTFMWQDLVTYATWDPATIVGALTLSAGNLHATTTTGSTQNVRGTIDVNSGKWYWENTLDAGGGSHATMMGVINTGTGTRYTYYTGNGAKYTNTTPAAYSSSSTTGDVIGVALDLTNNQLTFYKNGTSIGLAFTLPAGTYKPFIYDPSSAANFNINITSNFGQTPFASVPTGFNAGLYTGSSIEDRSGLTPGTYTVNIIDSYNCNGTVTATITEPSATLSGTAVVTNVSCFGGSNGTINLTPAGGAAPYTYNWGGSVTTEDRTGLAAGTYSVIITDASGCRETVSTTITEPATSVLGTTVVTNVACFGGNTGAINLTPTGGTGSSYTFNWLPSGPTTEDRTGLVAGTYSVQITDINGCIGTVTATVNQPTTPVSGTTVVTNVACFGGNTGAINLTPAGGSGSYTFNWLPSGPTTEDRTGLVVGTYSVQITDLNGCVGTVTATVTQPTTPVSGTTVVTTVSCFGGSNGTIDLTPAGGNPGYTYNWGSSITSEDRTGLAAGTYTVIITDANGCTGTTTATVNQPTTPVSGTTAVSNVSCFGGSNGTINLTPAGGTGPGYTFNWGSGITTEDRTGLTDGTYTAIITDMNGCTGTVTANISQPVFSTMGMPNVTNVSCFGGSDGQIDFGAFGGTPPYTFSWSDGPVTEDRTNLVAGTYTVTITDFNGCTASSSPVVSEPPASVSSMTITACDTYTLNGTTYTADGIYTQVLTGASSIGCDSTITLNLDILHSTVSALSATACSSYTLNGTTYTTSGIFIQNLTNTMGCDSMITLNLIVNQPTTSTLNTIACSSYSLNGTTYTVSGTYTQALTSAAGCDSTLTLNLIVNQPTTSTLNTTACSSYTLNGTTYTVSGTYTQALTSTAGCDSTLMLNLIVNQPTTSTLNATACSSYTLNGTTYTVSGTYTQALTSAAGCDSTLTLNLIVNQPTTSTLSATACSSYTLNGTTYTVSGTYTQALTSTAGCDSTLMLNLIVNQPTTSTLNATACGSYTLNGTTYTTSGAYTQNLLNAAGCDSTITLVLTIGNVDASVTQTGETLTATENNAVYQWIDCNNNGAAVPNETNQSFSAAANGNYAVIVTSGSCTDTSACMSVTTIGIRSAKAGQTEVLIMPNPNTGTFTIKAAEGIYYLINELGQQIRTIGLNADTNYSVHIDNLAAGVYYLIGKEQSTRSKIVVTD